VFGAATSEKSGDPVYMYSNGLMRNMAGVSADHCLSYPCNLSRPKIHGNGLRQLGVSSRLGVGLWAIQLATYRPIERPISAVSRSICCQTDRPIRASLSNVAHRMALLFHHATAQRGALNGVTQRRMSTIYEQ